MKTNLIYIISIFYLLSSCCDCQPEEEEKDLSEMYDLAIADAVKMEPGECYDSLRVLTDDSIDVVTWISEDLLGKFKPNFLNDTAKTIKGFDTWVTVIPDLSLFCDQERFETVSAADLRLKQLLGLPMSSEKEYFVELRARRQDLYRPTPDSSVTAVSAFILDDSVKGKSYKDWYMANLESSFEKKRKYPWTRLGYTYDWGNPYSEIGLSEFVIPGSIKGADFKVKVIGIYNTEQYCLLSKR